MGKKIAGEFKRYFAYEPPGFDMPWSERSHAIRSTLWKLRSSGRLSVPEVFYFVYDTLSWSRFYSRALCGFCYAVAILLSGWTLLTGVWWVTELVLWGHGAA